MVILLNRFTVHSTPEEFEEVFKETAVWMRSRPGFIRHTLVKSLRDPKSYVNIAQWQEAANHIAAVTSPEFKLHVEKLTKVATSNPDLFSPVLEVAEAGVEA